LKLQTSAPFFQPFFAISQMQRLQTFIHPIIKPPNHPTIQPFNHSINHSNQFDFSFIRAFGHKNVTGEARSCSVQITSTSSQSIQTAQGGVIGDVAISGANGVATAFALGSSSASAAMSETQIRSHLLPYLQAYMSMENNQGARYDQSRIHSNVRRAARDAVACLDSRVDSIMPTLEVRLHHID
jgi:hypothetical protein